MQTKKLIIALFAILLVGGLVYRANWIASRQIIACTEEALLCPDGSYVGRTGEQCVFKACPNQDSFTGTLRQDANGFALIMGSPEGGAGVAYVMPLTAKTNNIDGQLAGRNVRVYGTFTEGISLAVDRLEELPGDAGNSTLGEVGVGKSVFINGVRVSLNKIVQDSRCPADVQCIQAGWVTASVTLQSETDTVTKDMSSVAAPTQFDSYEISIISVKPLKKSVSPTAPGDYLITFRVDSR